MLVGGGGYLKVVIPSGGIIKNKRINQDNKLIFHSNVLKTPFGLKIKCYPSPGR